MNAVSGSYTECFSDPCPTTADTSRTQTLTPPPSQSSGSTSPVLPIDETEMTILPDMVVNKKKKKKKPKKSAKAVKETAAKPAVQNVQPDSQPPPLCISRNKHWKYISSFHGPWLQLPLELLESLLVLNLDPAMLSGGPDNRLPNIPQQQTTINHVAKTRDRGFASLSDHTPPDSPRAPFTSLPPPPPFPSPPPGKAIPPPIDPGIFRSVSCIRKLIDEASELSVRASSGLSAAALGSMRGGGASGMNSSPWSTAQSLGFGPLGDGSGGRNVAMSAMRVHRLRALAVQKLAAAYKADEIASSVMVMQGGSVFDDIAERVLKHDPDDVDAKYVHFFHEKIPSRQLAESTTTQVLDSLIASQPHRLEFFRTRGIIHCFRDEYVMAAKDFTHALKEARAQRKVRLTHRSNGNLAAQETIRSKSSNKKKKKKDEWDGQASSGGIGGTSGELQLGVPPPTVQGPDGEPILLHPSVLPEAPDPIEPQCLFLRGAAYLQHAVFLIESAILELEGIRKVALPDGAELRLCYLENSKYGGVEIGNPDGPLGKKDGVKMKAYRQVLNDEGFKETIMNLVKKSIRDHERFLAHFDTLEGLPYPGLVEGDLAQRVEYAFHLSESFRPSGVHHGSSAGSANFSTPEVPTTFTTYHPLLVEAHFSRLICLLILGDFSNLLPTFLRTVAIVDGLEGYPIFLPPRSMAQAEFIEVLERLAGGWKTGLQPNSYSRKRITSAGYVPSAKTSGKEKQVEDFDSSELYLVDNSVDKTSSPTSSTSTTLLNAAASSSTASSSALSSPPLTPTMGGKRGLGSDDIVLMQALDNLRILLAPIAKRQRNRVENDEAGGGKRKKGLSINIPLHGPRVEVVLAWLAAVHLFDLEGVAM